MSTTEQLFDVQEWASLRRVATITRHLLLATEQPQRDLLGRIFSFLTHPETREVLVAWASQNDQAKQLLDLAEAAIKVFPPLPSRHPPGEISTLYASSVTSHPLATMLASPMPPLAEAKERTLLTALKTLTLMRSVAQAERGWRNGPEVDFVCRQIRLATDREIRNSEKLRVIYELAQFSADLPTYLAGLNSEATTSREKERIGTSETVLQEFVRRIGNVAKNDLGTEPLSLAFAPSIARTPIPIPLNTSRNDKVLLEFERHLEEFPEPSDHELEHDRADSIEIAEYSEPVTPELQYRIGKSFLQQTQADRNYLPYAWNRLRPDEIDTLQKHLANWLKDYSKALLASFASISQLARSSIETACNIKIANKPAGSAWVLDLAGGRLLRQTMRPQSSSQNDTDRLDTQEKRSGWIRPLAETQSVALSQAVLAPLAAAMAANPDAGELGELWKDTGESPWTAFNQLCACTPGLERVTHGKLALTAEQIVFEKNGSGVMARMLLTPAHATKSPASWYPSWSLEQG
jgi:hypothetical protein